MTKKQIAANAAGVAGTDPEALKAVKKLVGTVDCTPKWMDLAMDLAFMEACVNGNAEARLNLERMARLADDHAALLQAGKKSSVVAAAMATIDYAIVKGL